MKFRLGLRQDDGGGRALETARAFVKIANTVRTNPTVRVIVRRDELKRGLLVGDPILTALTAPVTESFVRYLRDELHFNTDRAYVLLNGKAARQWNWDDDGASGSPGAAQALQQALQRDPKLRVIVAGGMTDLVAPCFMNAYVIDHLPQAARDRIALKLYAGGHMMYLRPGSRAALQRDARTLFRRAS